MARFGGMVGGRFGGRGFGANDSDDASLDDQSALYVRNRELKLLKEEAGVLGAEIGEADAALAADPGISSSVVPRKTWLSVSTAALSSAVGAQHSMLTPLRLSQYGYSAIYQKRKYILSMKKSK